MSEIKEVKEYVKVNEFGNELPTVIRGCWWDDGWEFDGPAVIYYPFFKYSDGGNAGEVYQMLEDVCIDLSYTDVDFNEMREDLKSECEWRKWSLYGFKHRKNATHCEYGLRWFYDDENELQFEVVSEKEQEGPFKKVVK